MKKAAAKAIQIKGPESLKAARKKQIVLNHGSCWTESCKGGTTRNDGGFHQALQIWVMPGAVLATSNKMQSAELLSSPAMIDDTRLAKFEALIEAEMKAKPGSRRDFAREIELRRLRKEKTGIRGRSLQDFQNGLPVSLSISRS